MTRKQILAMATLVAALPVAPVGAEGDSFDALLGEIARAREAEAAADAAREQEFLSRRDRQKKLLAEAQAAWDAATARSQQLSARFDANEKELSELEGLLRIREGNLGELFGVTRQAAGEAASAVFNSMTSAQFQGRDAFLARLAKAKVLPNSRELEDLGVELLREIAETGRVARFTTDIVNSAGDSERADVVRVGGFIAMSGDRFLTYVPDIGKFSVLPRQPAAELREAARQLSEAREGYVKSVIDPSRGALLAIYAQRPSVLERIEKGEEVGYVIILVGVVGAICALYQFGYLVLVNRRVKWQLAHPDAPTSDNPLGRVLSTFRGSAETVEDDVEVVELRISEAVLREVPILERFQAFLRLAVAAGPLLGLIGTVIGMIITFQSITESGSSDPRLMAAGIGQAMIATVLGLGIAIPLLFVNAGLSTLSQGIVQVLDEQSAGLLAEFIERARGNSVGRGESHA
jgi:biopolymer transport protein ExbB